MSIYYKNQSKLRDALANNLEISYSYDYSIPPDNLFYKDLTIEFENSSIWAIPLRINKEEIVFGLFNGLVIKYDLALNQIKRLLSFNDKVYSSPILSFNNHYMVVATDSGDLACYDLKKEKLLWRRILPSAIHSSPNYYDKKLYIGCYDNHLYTIDIINGEIINNKLMEAGIAEDPYSSPIVTSKLILIGSGNYLYALNLDLTVKWRVNCGSFVDSTPAVSELTNNCIIGTEQGDIFIFDLEQGEIINKISTSSAVLSSPAITADNIACIGNNNGELFAFNLVNGQLIWTKTFNSKFYYTSIASADRFFIFVLSDGSINCINSDNGSYQWQIEGKEKKFHSPPLVTKDMMFLGSHFGYIGGYNFKIKDKI